MKEDLGCHINIESQERLAEKSVILMYPDVRTTHRYSLVSERLVSEYSNQFLKITNFLLERYSRKGYEIKAITYTDTYPDNFSPNYPLSQIDQIVNVPVMEKEWNIDDHFKYLREIYPILKLKQGSPVIMGGFHAIDCVATMTAFLRKIGHTVSSNLLLTNALNNYIGDHGVCQKYPQFYSAETKRANRANYSMLPIKFEQAVLEKNQILF